MITNYQDLLEMLRWLNAINAEPFPAEEPTRTFEETCSLDGWSIGRWRSRVPLGLGESKLPVMRVFVVNAKMTGLPPIAPWVLEHGEPLT